MGGRAGMLLRSDGEFAKWRPVLNQRPPRGRPSLDLVAAPRTAGNNAYPSPLLDRRSGTRKKPLRPGRRVSFPLRPACSIRVPEPVRVTWQHQLLAQQPADLDLFFFAPFPQPRGRPHDPGPAAERLNSMQICRRPLDHGEILCPRCSHSLIWPLELSTRQSEMPG